MSSGNNSLRKALGALKDSTTVSLAKVNSDYKDLDIAIVRATNHVERPAKEKHIRAIFSAISASRPRADVAYCIHALSRRLAKTHNWAVALKTLIVIHRALREVDPTFREELINYGTTRSHMLNLSHFKDDSSPNAWDYSSWVRTYALFLEERLECFRVLKYDVQTDPPVSILILILHLHYSLFILFSLQRTRDLDTADLLHHIPALQMLLFRVLGCQPQGAAVYNFVIQLALSMVAGESIKIYNAISDGTINMVDKFFEMPRHEAVRALEIYRKAGQQAERLSEFYEICKSLDLGRGEKFIKIEQPPASFITAMEEYVRDAPRASSVQRDKVEKIGGPKEVLALEYKKSPELETTRSLSPPPTETESETVKAKTQTPVSEPPDLLNMNDPIPDALDLDEKNALALAIVPVEASEATATPAPSFNAGTTGWELALITAPSSNESAIAAATRLGGGLDMLTLDSLYDDAMRRSNQNVSYNPWEQQQPMHMQQQHHDPFLASGGVAAPHSVQMAAMMQQQQAFMFQQQQSQPPMGGNPFGNPYAAAAGGGYPYGGGIVPVQSYNPHTGLI